MVQSPAKVTLESTTEADAATAMLGKSVKLFKKGHDCSEWSDKQKMGAGKSMDYYAKTAKAAGATHFAANPKYADQYAYWCKDFKKVDEENGPWENADWNLYSVV